jgi:hypothetical protein
MECLFAWKASTLRWTAHWPVTRIRTVALLSVCRFDFWMLGVSWRLGMERDWGKALSTFVVPAWLKVKSSLLFRRV